METMARVQRLNKGIHLRWEKPTALGVRYYEVDLDQDLWDEWRLPRRGPGAGRGHPGATATTPV